MEALIRLLCGEIALAVEAVAAAVISCGTLEALIRLARALIGREALRRRREVWRRLAFWLLLGLAFELAADIVRSAIAPTWEDIGQLAAIAGIRTFLNYFLQMDIERSLTQEKVHAAQVT